MLKNCIHQTLIAHGHPRPGVGLYTQRGRALLARLELPEPWRETVQASLALIDALDVKIAELERELRRLGASIPTCRSCARCPGSPRCSPTRSPPRLARSLASQAHAS
jgi:transposase